MNLNEGDKIASIAGAQEDTRRRRKPNAAGAPPPAE